MKPWKRADSEKVTPEEYAYVMRRDGSCVARQIDPDHRCEGRDTVDHVPEKNMNALGKRALCSIHRASDRHVLVRLCWGANVNGWASAHRDEERDWIRRKEPND